MEREWRHHRLFFAQLFADAESCARRKALVFDALPGAVFRANVDKVLPMDDYIDAWRYARDVRDNLLQCRNQDRGLT